VTFFFKERGPLWGPLGHGGSERSASGWAEGFKSVLLQRLQVQFPSWIRTPGFPHYLAAAPQPWELSNYRDSSLEQACACACVCVCVCVCVLAYVF